MSSTLTVDPGAVREVRHHGSAARLVVADCRDRAAALTALARARDDLYAIPHPLEPDAPLPNSATVEDTADGPLLWFDVKDEGPAYADQIVGLVADRLREAGVGGTLRAGRDSADDDGSDDDGSDDDGSDDDAPPVVREWSRERPAVPWPTELAGPSGASPAMVLGGRRHGERWLVAHWESGEPDVAGAVTAALTAAGWTLTPVTGAAELGDPDLVGPFSDAGTAPGLRIWRAERDGWPVVVGAAPTPDGWLVRMTTPVDAVPPARPSTPGAAPPWPPGFPSGLPPVVDAAAPPMAVTAPGVDGASWRQAQWGRRASGHATDFVAALAASDWQVEAADDAARSTMAAAFAGRRGGLGNADVRGWNASRDDGGRLFVISVSMAGAGALLVVSTPAD